MAVRKKRIAIGKTKDPVVAGMQVRTEGAGMFGARVRRVLAVRPILKKRGGVSQGDEAVILTHRVYPSGKRDRGSVSIMDADEAERVFVQPVGKKS